MAENFSLRARIKAMAVGELLVVSKTDYAPSVVGTTTYRVKRDATDDRNYTTRTIDQGVEVRRIA